MSELDDSELETNATVDGVSYRIKVVPTTEGFEAHLAWITRGVTPDNAMLVSPPFKSARAALIEGHAMAEESILACRRR